MVGMPSTAERVLPWRRAAPDDVLAPVLESHKRQHGKNGAELIRKAYTRADIAHEEQLRRSGDPYIRHPLAVAGIVADLGLDAVSISGALLHDAVEDTGLTITDLRQEFGAEVADIVDGVTKLERLRFESREAQQAASMRKMLVAVAKDLRVLVIKLADRLHNLRTLAAMPERNQERTARETLDIYAPLAHRLGMQAMKQELEDLAFAALYPKRYAAVDQMVHQRAPEREVYLTQVLEEVRSRLAEQNIDAEVAGRPKHLWSIYEKMVNRDKDFDDIFDLVGIRVVVDDVKDCYGALGTIHATWMPVDGRFKDYIALPKFNLYQSLHTTVVGPQAKPLEVQIRTTEMHERAERGIAAHWSYKEPSVGADDLEWLKRIIELQEDAQDPSQFMADLREDLVEEEVYVFTPKGDVVTLPPGATPIDFAYSIHTQVGHSCIGAKVNGRLVALDSKLSSGDTVDVLTSKGERAGPSRDWLNVAVTPRARTKIRAWFSRERREDAIEAGREDVAKAFRREGLPAAETKALIDMVAQDLNYADADALYAAVGDNHVSPKAVATRAAKLRRPDEAAPDGEVSDYPLVTRPHRRGTAEGVRVEGLDDVLVRLAPCCTPVPGDRILGFVTRTRGVSVHRVDCANAVSLTATASERVVEVSWDADAGTTFVTTIQVTALDRERLLRDVSAVLADHHVNVVNSTTWTGSDGVAVMRFDFELGDAAHLASVLGAIRAIDVVYDAYRILPGKRE